MDIYYKDGAYAMAHNERDLFRASRQESIACSRFIDKAISANFDGWRLAKHCLADVLDMYDAARIAIVLAATVKDKAHDGRISRANKEWADGIRLPESDSFIPYLLNTHPAVLNGFIDMFRRQA